MLARPLFDVWPDPLAQDCVPFHPHKLYLMPLFPVHFEHLKQNQVVTWGNASLAAVFSCLPPPTTDVANFQDLVLGEGNFVGIIGVRLVAIDGLCTVRVLGRRDYLSVRAWNTLRFHLLVTESVRSNTIAGPWCGRDTSHGRRVLKAIKLGGCIHLRRLYRSGGLGPATTITTHGLAVHHV